MDKPPDSIVTELFDEHMPNIELMNRTTQHWFNDYKERLTPYMVAVAKAHSHSKEEIDRLIRMYSADAVAVRKLTQQVSERFLAAYANSLLITELADKEHR